MTHARLSMLALVLIILLSTGFARAQQTSSTSENAATADAALREKAFALLESVEGQLSSLQSAENRARLGANIVDSFWKHDEKRARALLLVVQQDIKTAIDNRESSDPRDEKTFMVFYRLRTDTVERIAKYDSELAYTFFKATAPSSDKPLPDNFAFIEREFELRLAHNVAAKNPDLTLKVARKYLEEGLADELIGLFAELNKKHKEHALSLYKDIIEKLREADLTSNWGLRFFFGNFVSVAMPPATDVAAFRELVNILTTNALANGCGTKLSDVDDRADFCRWAASTIPDMEKFDSRSARLKRWRPEDEEVANSSPSRGYELEDAMQNGQVEDVLRLAAKYPEQSNDIYYYALYRLVNSGDFDRARKIVKENVADEDRRQDMLMKIDLAQKQATFDEQKLAEVQAKLETIPRLGDRASYLLAHSGAFGATDQKVALKLLTQAREIIDNMKPGMDQTRSQIGLAMMYCLQKNDRGLTIMESLIPKLNELVEVAAKLDGYDTSYLRDGEWDMSANGAVGELLTLLAHNARYFAWCDFDRAASLAAQFERSEIRMMAQVKLAQGVLAGPPKRLLNNAELMR